jgi:hypothetical protein
MVFNRKLQKCKVTHNNFVLFISYKFSRATLAAGLMSLKSKIEKERETEKNTQKTNLCSLINCVDSLTKLHSKIAHEGEKANNLSNKTASILRNVSILNFIRIVGNSDLKICRLDSLNLQQINFSLMFLPVKTERMLQEMCFQ